MKIKNSEKPIDKKNNTHSNNKTNSVLTEKEKMLKGMNYFAFDKQLVEERNYARKILEKLNSLPYKKGEKRKSLFKKLLGKTGDNFLIEKGFNCDYGYNIFIGENFFANFNLTVLDCAKVIIGDNCLIGPCVKICAAEHPLNVEQRIKGEESAREIAIGNNVWIGAGAIINPGVNIGDNCVIGSGAVVTKSIPNNCVAVGVPAKVIKQLK